MAKEAKDRRETKAPTYLSLGPSWTCTLRNGASVFSLSRPAKNYATDTHTIHTKKKQNSVKKNADVRTNNRTRELEEQPRANADGGSSGQGGFKQLPDGQKATTDRRWERRKKGYKGGGGSKLRRVGKTRASQGGDWAGRKKKV